MTKAQARWLAARAEKHAVANEEKEKSQLRIVPYHKVHGEVETCGRPHSLESGSAAAFVQLFGLKC